MISDSNSAKIRSITERLNDKELNSVMIEMGREMERMDYEIRTLKSLTAIRNLTWAKFGGHDVLVDNDVWIEYNRLRNEKEKTKHSCKVTVHFISGICETFNTHFHYVQGDEMVFNVINDRNVAERKTIPRNLISSITIE